MQVTGDKNVFVVGEIFIFTQKGTPHILRTYFVIHSHDSSRHSGEDCWGSRDGTLNCCVAAWYQLVDLTNTNWPTTSPWATTCWEKYCSRFRFTRRLFNPNPHCFIAKTKATACGRKKPLLPHPLHSPEGGGGATFTALKIYLIKMWVTLKLSSKAHWKWRL
jgi:hypothetical protein